jgi:ABC-type dipeptide/oligopeptide/nickel transport system permease component
LTRFLLRRLVALAATTLVAISLTYLFFVFTVEQVTAPGPLLSSLGRYLEDLLLHFDMGPSFLGVDIPVREVLLDGLRVDLALLVGGTLAAAAWGVPCGLYCGARPGSRPARALGVVGSVVLSSPVYWLGFMVLILFANESGRIVQLPFVSGQGDYSELSGNPLDWGRAMWVPVLVVGAPLGAQLLRMTAGSVRDALGEEYIRTARAKGVAERQIVARHALPTAATPLFMLTGVNANLLVTNIVLMESAFNLPGSFRFIDDAIALRDIFMIQGLVVEWTVVIVLANFAADVLQAWLDPRVRM